MNELWVSKTDITDYIRCPYRVYIANKLNVRPIDLEKTSQLDYLIEQGRKFESKTLDTILPNKISVADTLKKLKYPKHINVDSNGNLTNDKLKLIGMPDIFRTQRKLLVPIEIKNHKDIYHSDVLELAFYNLLLAQSLNSKDLELGIFYQNGLRDFTNNPPIAYIILNDMIEYEVDLNKDDYDEAINLINDVRRVKTDGTEPCITKECSICSLKEQCIEHIKKYEGVSLVWGVGYNRVQQLKQAGITTLQQLAVADSQSLLDTIKSNSVKNCGLGINDIDGFKFGAKSWLTQKTLRISPCNILDKLNEYAVLDLEYTNTDIFLIGIALCSNKHKTEYIQYFAKNRADTKRILKSLCSIILENKTLPIITYAGKMADIPFIRKSVNDKIPLSILELNHIDIFQVLIQYFRFPLKSHGLKEIGAYLGFDRKLPDTNGMDAMILYDGYLNSKSTRTKKKIENELLEYNKEDLDATIFVINKLKELSKDNYAENN